MTRMLQVNPRQPETAVIETAAEVIRAGRLVAFPTETVYGLGANALSAEAIQRIYTAKQRPASDPIIAHIAHIDQLHHLATDIPDIAWQLAQRFMPGALTLVLRRHDDVPANIANGLETVAVRMPSHPVAHALIDVAGTPIAAPSANTFTRPSATTAQHVLQDLDGRVDVILDGGLATIGLESTVLDLTGETPVVLRPGGVLVEQLREVIPIVQVSPRYVDEATATTSPGQMLKHYSPDANVILFSGDDSAVIARMQAMIRESNQRVGVLIADEDQTHFAAHADVITLGSRQDLSQIGHGLFAAFRRFDQMGVNVILVRDFGRDGLGAALWDRLLRAAEGQVIQVD